MNSSPSREHNRFQVHYYRRADRRSIRPVDTPYVRRHFEEVVAAAGLEGSQRVLEVGCGSGRFTRRLCDRGLRVTANDLSPALLESLAERTRNREHLETVACDLVELPDRVRGRFNRAVGFFVLHHLFDLDAAFRALARVLEPGARVAFSEPNGYNPLFYLQIFLTPSMSWKAERGIRHMVPRTVLSAMERQGFADLQIKRYGFFPPWLANTSAGGHVERFLETISGLRPASAFQVFSGRLEKPEC